MALNIYFPGIYNRHIFMVIERNLLNKSYEQKLFVKYIDFNIIWYQYEKISRSTRILELSFRWYSRNRLCKQIDNTCTFGKFANKTKRERNMLVYLFYFYRLYFFCSTWDILEFRAKWFTHKRERPFNLYSSHFVIKFK